MGSGRRGSVAVAALSTLAIAAVAAPGPAAADEPRAGKSVIGGNAASLSDWPWQAAITRKGRLHCGGSVIAPTKILTAAHCVLGSRPKDLTVITGRPNLTDAAVGQTIGVASTSAYPGYGGNSAANDFGVITLAQPTIAPPVTLATAGESAAATGPGAVLQVAGWGNQHPARSKPSLVLKAITQYSAGDGPCFKEYGRKGLGAFQPTSMLCVKGQKFRKFRSPETGKKVQGRTSACSGDSGGPLMADTPSGPRQVGTVSFGPLYCGFRGRPSVYGRVSSALAFINGA